MINNCSANYMSVWGIIIWPNSSTKILCWFSFQTCRGWQFQFNSVVWQCWVTIGQLVNIPVQKAWWLIHFFVPNIQMCFIICYGWQFQFDKMLFDKGCSIIIGQVVNTPFGKVCTNCEIFISVAMFELIWNGQMR